MQNKPISAMIVLVLLILVFIFFGKRWFQYGQLKGTTGWTSANANAIAKANSQSGSSTPTPSTPATLMGISPPSDCPAPETPAKPTVWPPIVNHCPDFMVLTTTGSCVDTNKLYGTTQIGQTVIQPYKGNTNVCPQITQPSTSQYLRWEGVVQAEGACNPANIGKPPATQV